MNSPKAGPLILIVMGVSGSGKSAVGSLLAGRLGVPFAEGDAFHPPGNVAKMHSGTPLDDADRRPWLAAIAAWIGDQLAMGAGGVVSCSALKRAYRDILIAGRAGVRLVYLRGTGSLIGRRLAGRHGHFMPASLLQSQLATLEEPAEEERAIVVAIDKPPLAIAEEVLIKLAAG